MPRDAENPQKLKPIGVSSKDLTTLVAPGRDVPEGVGVQWELRGAVARRDVGRTPSHLSAIPPPRGRPGEGPMDLPFRVEYLDAERLLPVLVRKAA
jgi:hypothetical protein